ncbi:MAG: cation-translocating P-type ATPase [Acidobacteriota bacterium]
MTATPSLAPAVSLEKSRIPRLRSAVPGRARWDVPDLYRHPRLAASVLRQLEREPKISQAKVNPATGRILVHFDPAQDLETIRPCVLEALDVEPLDVETWRRLKKAEADREAGVEISGCCGHEHAPQGGEHVHGDDCDHQHDDPATYRRKLWIGGSVLGAIGLKRLVFGAGALASSPVLFSVSAMATIVTGWTYLRGALRPLTSNSGVSTDTLIGSATVASLLLRENITGLTVIWLLNLGEYLQGLTLHRTRVAIRQLLDLGDETIWIVVDGTEVSVPLEQVRPGDLVVVHTGRKVPVDGMVEEGSATLNEAPITGESMPVIRSQGNPVFAGTIVLAGEIRVRVEKVGADTAVGRLIRRVEEAQDLKAPIQTVGDRFSRHFVPFSFALALVTFAVTRDYRRSLTMLLIACPCAAGLATPTAVSAAIGNGARRGFLIKGGTHLEAAANLDAVVFDKTGTLTRGLPNVERVISVTDDHSVYEVLSLAASGELHSQHPLALAVVAHAEEKEVRIPEHERCEAIIGRGMVAQLNGHKVLVGSRRLMDENEIEVSDEAQKQFEHWAQHGDSMMYVAYENHLVGMIGVRDTLRPEAGEALKMLQRLRVERQVMLTGDTEPSAIAVADELGIGEWQARLLPEQKHDFIRDLQANGHRVAMLGDGINDAPALAIADVGIAMGTSGSDVAIEAADIALASDDLGKVASVVRLSKRTLDLIRQNYALAVGVNAGGLLVGAAGAINPLLAALLHNLSTLAVTFNSARLITFDPNRPRRSER